MLGLLITALFGSVICLFQPPPPANLPPSTAPAMLTEAERITKLRQALESSLESMAALQAQLDDPNSDYQKAESEFQKLDERLKEVQTTIEKLNAEGDTEAAMKQQELLNKLTIERKEARDRFDLAITQRRATMQALAALKVRVEQEKKQLDKLEGKNQPAETAPKKPSDPPTKSTPPTGGSPAPQGPPAAAPNLSIPGLPTIPTDPKGGLPPGPPKPVDAKVVQAQNKLETRKKALQEAEKNVQTVDERIDTLKKAISSTTELLFAERAATDQVQQSVERMTKALKENPPQDFRERQELVERISDGNTRINESRERIRLMTDEISSLNEQLHSLEAERLQAYREAEQRRKETEVASQELERISNPFTSRNLLKWASTHGPNLIIILLVTIGLYILVRLFSRQIVQIVIRTSHRGTEEDRENRANTLVGVFRYTAGLLIIGGGLVMLLDESGIPIIPLMGGAAVLGLAIAFGAQNLIKDYFSGFMMLMEDQYGVNDVVKIGDTAGLVEKITLRITVLRDLEGVRHFIPHGCITQVSNMTHTWSRALFDVPVAYGEDADRVMKILMDLSRELRLDPEFGRYIIEDAEMLGVDGFGDSAVIIKFLIKTKPLKQWLVKREMLRRIKNRFDQLGITIPFPQRTVHHKFPEGVPSFSMSEQFSES